MAARERFDLWHRSHPDSFALLTPFFFLRAGVLISVPALVSGAGVIAFGSIAALFGLTHGLISQQQYSELLTAVLLSALVPTLIARQLFQPTIIDQEEEEALGAEDATTFGRRSPERSDPSKREVPSIRAPRRSGLTSSTHRRKVPGGAWRSSSDAPADHPALARRGCSR